ncbi:hypothetical protein CCY99_04280 [Helicobacter sp. 16-1353]|uniref:hypothetical protein n=1 Tax=Helicobacter sp. 16-1353 TaxID=2004996 RepID=UPI000DCE7A25|nr:hypothetical protein [Helicobacter sp. 16-1353]RAX54234.1 hypothetical protein CCY99_04280 [Helicobacter sp. 16-1353]
MQTKIINDVDDISKILNYLSVKSHIPIDDLEVRIKSYNTYMKKKGAEFFELLKDDDMDLIDDDNLFESDSVDFRQSYNIQIFKKQKKDNFGIRINNNFESLDLILHKGFSLPKDINEIENFIDSINALKATKGILLRKLKDEKEIISKNLQYIKDTLEDDLVINLYTSKIFRDSRDSKIQFFIKDIDLSKKNIICAKENTLICAFYPAKDGVEGRNMQGIYTKSEAKVNNPLAITADFNEIVENDCKKYINLKSGFVIFYENSLSFNEELSFQNLKIKDNYHFIGDLDSNTSLLIGTDDEFEDALKDGVSIMASKITISGNIGANTRVKANDLVVMGQTHKDSTIIANKASINVHKGKLDSNSATIQSLESGDIDCNDLEIIKANGGTLAANNININEVYSNSIIKFSNKCVVDIMKGGGNKIIFTPLGNKKNREKILNLEKNLKNNVLNQKALNLKLESLIYKYNKYKNTAIDLKNIIQKHIARNEEIPDYVVKNYNSFLDIVESIKALKTQNLDMEQEKIQIKQDLKTTQEEVFNAEFICKDGWLKYNDVLFELIFPKANSSKTIIKGAGRYYFEPQERKIIHQRIFKNDSDETIDKYGF